MKKNACHLPLLLNILFFTALGTILVTWAYLAPLGDGPDETLRYLIPYYIFRHGRLPYGSDLETIAASTYGISYAFFPYLAAIFEAFYMKIASCFTDSPFLILFAGRLFSVTCGLLSAVFVRLTARRLFPEPKSGWLFTLLCCMWPEVMFLNTYINSDSLALLSCSIQLYGLVLGLQKDWNARSITVLSVGFSLCALSYYNAYGMILSSILVVVLSCLYQKKYRRLGSSALLSAAICFVLCGWWFLRNAIAYHGDLLGITSNIRQASRYGLPQYQPASRPSLYTAGAPWYCLLFGPDADHWLSKVRQSYIAAFGHSQIILGNGAYRFYRAIVWLAILGFVMLGISRLCLARKKKQPADTQRLQTDTSRKSFVIGMILSFLIPFLLCYLYSYLSDYQPQGRYLMPGHLALALFLTAGISGLLRFHPMICEHRCGLPLCRMRPNGLPVRIVYLVLCTGILLIALESILAVSAAYLPILADTHALQFTGGPL